MVARPEAPATLAGRLDRQHAATHLGLEPPGSVRGHDPGGEVARIGVGARLRAVGLLHSLEPGDPERPATELGARERGAAAVVARHLEVGQGFAAEVTPRREQGGDLPRSDDAGQAAVGRERPHGKLGRHLEAHPLPRRCRRLLAEDPLDELVGATHARTLSRGTIGAAAGSPPDVPRRGRTERCVTRRALQAGSLAPRNDWSFTRFFSSRLKLGVS